MEFRQLSGTRRRKGGRALLLAGRNANLHVYTSVTGFVIRRRTLLTSETGSTDGSRIDLTLQERAVPLPATARNRSIVGPFFAGEYRGE